MKLIYLASAIFLLFANNNLSAQGCVAIKGISGTCSRPSDSKSWELNLNSRYFKSYKHYVGTKEQKQRVDSSTNVINHAFELDITATRTLNSRWSLSMTLPVLSFGRSSLYEHDGKTRHSTHSFGIGDIRLSAYRWILNPSTSHKGNIQLGIGLKLPTGNFNYQDYFYKKADSSVLGAVDQSIQPGDGGTGVTVELNSYYLISHKVSFYGSGFYLINPREVNGTSTTRGGVASATAKKYNTDVMSVPDLYMFRSGISYMSKKITIAGGVRIEGLPAKDLTGGSRGFRRPGYIISAEPSFTFTNKKTSFNLAVPVAIKRSRTQSNADKRRTVDTGTHQQGDAAFADYLISAGVIFKL